MGSRFRTQGEHDESGRPRRDRHGREPGRGRTIARELAREGVDLAICARNRQALEETAGALAKETATPGGLVRGPLAEADEKALLNLVYPGTTRTERTDPETERRAAGNAIRRIVDAHEVAQVVAFLASTKAAAVTGVAIDASGGSIPVMFQ
jgi:NAD(P)-dependent dehydrogenase (short-subunit alcohol dehydrogenase family)